MKFKELPNGQWYASFQLGGKQQRRWGSNRKELEEAIDEEKFKFKNNGITPEIARNGVRFERLCTDYYDDCVKREVKGLKSLKSQLKCLKQDFDNGRNPYAKDCSKLMVEEWMIKYKNSVSRLFLKKPNGEFVIGADGQRVPKPIDNASVNRKYNTLRAVFNHAIDRGFMVANPCRTAEKYKEKGTFKRFLDQDEIKKLTENSPSPNFTHYCMIGLHSGMRPGEILGLFENQFENVDLDNRLIYLMEQKNGEQDTIAIDDELYPLLKQLKQQVSAGVKVEYTPALLRRDAEEAIKLSKINEKRKPGTGRFTIYGLRHTFASHLLMAGEDIKVVKEWLRHASIETTDKHYGHLTKDHLRKAANKINLMKIGPKLKVVGE